MLGEKQPKLYFTVNPEIHSSSDWFGQIFVICKIKRNKKTYNFLIKTTTINLKLLTYCRRALKPPSEDKVLIVGSWSNSLQVRSMFCWARQEWTGQTYSVLRLFYFTANDSVLQPFGSYWLRSSSYISFQGASTLISSIADSLMLMKLFFLTIAFFLSQRWSQFSYFMFAILQWDVFFHYCNWAAEALGLKLSMLQSYKVNHGGWELICAVWR